jgi:leucyl/phenylalanyl-tRNA--protein transferase
MFGESMFSLQTDASKIALAALVAFCKTSGIQMIDCQQNTRHLASLGGQEITRADFLFQIAKTRELPSPNWRFDPLYWNQVIPSPQKL